MLRKRDDVKYEDFKEHGFKFGTRDRLIYKTTSNKIESAIYIDLLPCHNNNDEIKVESPSHSIPTRILDKLHEITTAGLIEKV